MVFLRVIDSVVEELQLEHNSTLVLAGSAIGLQFALESFGHIVRPVGLLEYDS